jgi:hypothetical protein
MAAMELNINSTKQTATERLLNYRVRRISIDAFIPPRSKNCPSGSCSLAISTQTAYTLATFIVLGET